VYFVRNKIVINKNVQTIVHDAMVIKFLLSKCRRPLINFGDAAE